MKATGLTFAIVSIGLTIAIVLNETIYIIENTPFFGVHAGYILAASVGFSGCAVAVVPLLLDRPRRAAPVAGGVVLFGAFILRDWATVSEMFVSPGQFSHWLAAAMPGRLLPSAALLQIVVGIACLELGLDRLHGSRDLRIALILFVPIALTAEALVMLVAGLDASNLTLLTMAASLVFLAGAMGAYGLRHDAALAAAPRLWLPVVLAVAIASTDLLATHSSAARWGYVLVVACGLLLPHRVFVRVLTTVSVGLALFGLVASQRSESASVASLLDAALAIGAIVLAGVLVDRQWQARQAHREMTERFAAIQQMTATTCFELDLASMAFVPSPAFDSLHGRTAPVRNDWRSFVAAYIPVEQQAALAASLAAAHHGRATDAVAYSFQRPDGERGDALLRWVPTRDTHGVIVSLTGIVHDVTLQRKSERGSAELRAKLDDALKLETLGLLAGGVAHDLSNTLVPLGILAPLVLETITDPTDRHSMDLIIESATRARELARAMLASTREEPTALERVRLDELVRDLLALLRARFPAGITIVDALAPVPAIEGNVCQLYQIVLNLTVNAAQAIGPRGGTITIGTAAEPSGDARARSVRLFVCDDGAGIRPEIIDHIFEPFASSKDGNEASGIGLAIVRRIVQTHSGVISVQSNLGQGARFDLLFPVARPVSGPPSPNLSHPSPASEAPWRSAST